MTTKPAFRASATNPNIKEIQTIPERRPDMPYAPAIRVQSPCSLLFISGATPSPARRTLVRGATATRQ
jgi:2-iminobutanoate/2-iminopropanoate deaminase